MASPILLRDVAETDLTIFFQHQLDPAANWMAAFTAEDPTDQNAFMVRWRRILGNEAIIAKTILYHGQVAGHVLTYRDDAFGEPEITYWIGTEYWGKGIATAALSAFLRNVTVRPLYARAVKDNIASIRVLEKCGFMMCGEGTGFANGRGEEVEEVVLKLG